MKTIILMPAILAASCLTACSTFAPTGPQASAELSPTQGNTAAGTVSFQRSGDGVRVVADIVGLSPGPHGFHIHDKGDCSAPDGTSAGGHFNPAGKPHGHPLQGDHHAGDMPMLEADASGRAHLEAVLAGLSIGGGGADILGRGVIIHAAADDFATQPTGNSGARLACGVIK